MKTSIDSRQITVIERGQTSIPAAIRKESKLKKGQALEWEMISKREFRVWVVSSEKKGSLRKALGYAKRHDAFRRMTSDEVLRKLRQGE